MELAIFILLLALHANFVQMAENNSLLDKLNGLVARFEEVSTLITDPSVIADQQRYVRLTKEYKIWKI